MEEENSTEITQNSNGLQHKKFLIPIFGIILPLVFAAIYFVYIKQNKVHTEEIHYHAGFQVYVNGTLQDFSDIKYMTLGICGENDHIDEQIEKAHLHDGVGDVVHVHRNGAVWGDLFDNIDYEFDSNKPMKAYINGQEETDIFSQNISAYDSLVIFIGDFSNSNELLEKSVTKDHILEVENKGESCSS